jgi:hypothetical protein
MRVEFVCGDEVVLVRGNSKFIPSPQDICKLYGTVYIAARVIYEYSGADDDGVVTVVLAKAPMIKVVA